VISSGSVPPSHPRRHARRSAAACAGLLVVSAALSGPFTGCSSGRRDTDLVLSLAPDSTCAAAPVSCVNELLVTLEDEGVIRGSWELPFDAVEGVSAPLPGNVPHSGSGTFRAIGRAALPGVAPVLLFSGESDRIDLQGRKDQRVVVPVSCLNVPDPCLISPTPTPDPFARFPNGLAADTIVGQSDFTTCQFNSVASQNGGIREPDGLWLTSTQLWVTDRNSGRLAVFDRIDLGALPVPLAFIEGHTGLGENQQGTTGDDFRRPRGLALDTAGGFLYVADTDNHRGPLFSPIPDDMTDPAADNVLGQDNPGDNNPNDGGPNAGSLLNPWSVLLVPGGLFVSDSGNNRLLHFARPVGGNQPNATALCGQADATLVAPNRGGAAARNSMNEPAHLATDGTRLYLADRANNRVLVWATVAAAAAGGDPDFVLGQPNFTSSAPNRGGAPAANTLAGPRGVAASARRLVVADSDNNRVLIWQPPPENDGDPATEVLGQPDFTTGGPNFGSATGGTCPTNEDDNTCPASVARPESDTLFRPGAAWEDGDHLYVSDTCNNRVLRFTATPP
jgi:hypothetical protein